MIVAGFSALYYDDSSSFAVHCSSGLRFGFEGYMLLVFDLIGEMSRFGDVVLFFRKWDGFWVNFIRLLDFGEFYFLLPGTYLFDMFITIITSDYHFCGQSIHNVKSYDFATTDNFDKQVDDPAILDMSVFRVTDRDCELYGLHSGPCSLWEYAFS